MDDLYLAIKGGDRMLRGSGGAYQLEDMAAKVDKLEGTIARVQLWQGLIIVWHIVMLLAFVALFGLFLLGS